MKVYAVAAAHHYEGYGAPVAVFSTLAAARSCAALLEEGDEVQVVALELNAAPLKGWRDREAQVVATWERTPHVPAGGFFQ